MFLLGGAVAIDLATKEESSRRIWCLILENTFTSIPDMAALFVGYKFLQYLPLFVYKNKVCNRIFFCVFYIFLYFQILVHPYFFVLRCSIYLFWKFVQSRYRLCLYRVWQTRLCRLIWWKIFSRIAEAHSSAYYPLWAARTTRLGANRVIIRVFSVSWMSSEKILLCE